MVQQPSAAAVSADQGNRPVPKSSTSAFPAQEEGFQGQTSYGSGPSTHVPDPANGGRSAVSALRPDPSRVRHAGTVPGWEGKGEGDAPLDTADHVVGVVSEADLLFKEVGPEPFTGPAKSVLATGRRGERAKAAAVTAAGLMSTPAITIGPGNERGRRGQADVRAPGQAAAGHRR